MRDATCGRILCGTRLCHASMVLLGDGGGTGRARRTWELFKPGAPFGTRGVYGHYDKGSMAVHSVAGGAGGGGCNFEKLHTVRNWKSLVRLQLHNY